MESSQNADDHSDAESDDQDIGSTRSDSPQFLDGIPDFLPSYDEVDGRRRPVAEDVIRDHKESVKGKAISAPCDVPYFRVGIAQSRRTLQFCSRKQKKHQEKKKSSSGFSPKDTVDWCSPPYEKTYIAHSQCAPLGGEHGLGVPPEDLQQASSTLYEALILRQKYMKWSSQSFSAVTAKFLESKEDDLTFDNFEHYDSEEPPTIKEPWKAKMLKELNCKFLSYEGVFQVFQETTDEGSAEKFGFPYPLLHEFVTDMQSMCAMITDELLESFCHRRLSYLSAKYQFHILLNEFRELAEQKTVSRDFYSTAKVDTHIQATSCMSQRHLLGFIKETMKKQADRIVRKIKEQPQTLKQVLKSLSLTTDNLSVDMFEVHTPSNTSHKLHKYNPIAENPLREIYLKTDNYMNGKYFANILKEKFKDLKESNYQHAEELRISIYGCKADEWERLSNWATKHNVYSDNVRWLVQVPRLYNVYRSNNLVQNFQQILDNIFLPLFEVTADPSSYPQLHAFLQYVIGFDSIGDESKHENSVFDEGIPSPSKWIGPENPPYSYYLYYMYANMCVLNHFRKSRGLNTFVLRPRCGESGPVQHLITGYLLCENISHGLLLREVPVLQYLYYLAQIGIAMSPLSNNSIFLKYHLNPLPEYHSRGLCVSLSTDDPLRFHGTKEPLIEEYNIAAQVFKLNSCDMCELARNSVLTSGFPKKWKCYWLGPNYMEEGSAGSNIERTNVPNIRVCYRYETLREELSTISLSKTS